MMNRHVHIRFLLGLLFILLIAPTLTFGDVYKWTDEEGKIHYGDKPPVQIESDEFQVKPGPGEEETQRAQQNMERLLKDVEDSDKRRKIKKANKKNEKSQETDKTSKEINQRESSYY